MLKHEFEKLLGYTVADKSYVEANTMYMNAGEMTKEDFCREWLKIGHTSLAHALSDSVSELRKQLDEAKQTMKTSKRSARRWSKRYSTSGSRQGMTNFATSPQGLLLHGRYYAISSTTKCSSAPRITTP